MATVSEDTQKPTASVNYSGPWIAYLRVFAVKRIHGEVNTFENQNFGHNITGTSQCKESLHALHFPIFLQPDLCLIEIRLSKLNSNLKKNSNTSRWE